MALDPRAKFIVTAVSDFSKAHRASKTFLGSIENAAKQASRVAGLAAAAGVAGALKLASDAAKSADALAKQADILGISTQKLAAYQHAAELSGSSADALEKGIRKLQKSIVDATNGLTTYTRAFEALRLDPAELKALTPDEQFERLAKAFAGVENQAERVAIAYDLFGGRNTALLNTLVLTGTELNKLEADTKAWGTAISRVDAKKIEEANDAVTRAKTALQGIGTRLALAFAPLRTDVANSFADAAAEAQGFQNQIDETMVALIAGANFAANSVRGIELAFLGAKLAALEVKRAAQESSGFFGDILKKQNVRPAFAILARGDANKTIDELDAVGRAIDALTGKFQSGEEAVQRYRALVSAADERARAAAATPTVPHDDGGDFELFGDKEREQLQKRLEAVQNALATEIESIRQSYIEREEVIAEAFEREIVGDEERQDLRLRNAQETASKLLALEKKRIDQQTKLEQQHQAVVTGLRQQAVDTAIGLLHTLGARSKALAIAAIVAEKAVAIARIIINTNVAAVRALAELGPIAGPPAAASITAWGYALAAATAAVGIGQIATLGSGSTGTTLGTPTNPVFTDTRSDQPRDRGENVTIINIHGNGILLQDELVNVMKKATDADQVIIRRNTAQAAEIRGE